MSSTESVIYYDGVVSKPRQAEISPINQDSVLLRYGDALELKQQYLYSEMILIGALGGIKPVIELKNDARIEFKNALPDWFNIKQKDIYQSIWKLERSPSLILFSVVFVVAFGFALVKWGIPFTSHYLAFQLPENTLTKIGNEAEEYVLNNLTQPSQLSQGQKDQIKSDYLLNVAEGRPAKLVFREGDHLGANAVALPNNTIIITDELVELAHSDQEIIGVLAHEQGHLVQRHSLQQGLSSLGFSVLYIAMTGDSSDLLTSLPAAMIGANYSRKFEQEADLYALNSMYKHHIEVSHFANFLQRLNEESDKVEGKTEKNPKKDEKQTDQQKPKTLEILDALSSHPATEERIQMVRDFEAKHPQINMQKPSTKE